MGGGIVGQATQQGVSHRRGVAHVVAAQVERHQGSGHLELCRLLVEGAAQGRQPQVALLAGQAGKAHLGRDARITAGQPGGPLQRIGGVPVAALLHAQGGQGGEHLRIGIARAQQGFKQVGHPRCVATGQVNPGEQLAAGRVVGHAQYVQLQQCPGPLKASGGLAGQPAEHQQRRLAGKEGVGQGIHQAGHLLELGPGRPGVAAGGKDQALQVGHAGLALAECRRPLQVGQGFVGALQVDQQGGAGHHAVEQARVGLQGLGEIVQRGSRLAGTLLQHALQVQELRIAGGHGGGGLQGLAGPRRIAGAQRQVDLGAQGRQGAGIGRLCLLYGTPGRLGVALIGMGRRPHGQHFGPGRRRQAIRFDAGEELLAVAEHHQRRTVRLGHLGHAGAQTQGDLELGFGGGRLTVPQQGLAQQQVGRQ